MYAKSETHGMLHVIMYDIFVLLLFDDSFKQNVMRVHLNTA